MSIETKTIFLVDDDATNLTVGNNALEEYYDIFTFSSGAVLLKVLEKNIPDLVLLDVEMPDMSGYDVIKLMKSNEATAHIPVIFLTAKSDNESELEGLSLGAIDYIFKPFSPSLLRKRIEVHLLVESQKQELIKFNGNLLKMVEEKTKTVVELQNAVLKTMSELVECRDDITGGHIDRTQGYLSILLNALLKSDLYAEEASLWDIKLVVPSAQLHDVGKIAIKDGILQKPGKLTEEEFEQIKKHTIFGAKVIKKIKEDTVEQAFLEYAEVFALTHHEKWNGSGYPNGLKGDEIPLLGRIMAIADVYDALVSERPYKKALTHEEAVDIILNERGNHFDPILTDLFLSISGEFKKIAQLYK